MLVWLVFHKYNVLRKPQYLSGQVTSKIIQHVKGSKAIKPFNVISGYRIFDWNSEVLTFYVYTKFSYWHRKYHYLVLNEYHYLVMIMILHISTNFSHISSFCENVWKWWSFLHTILTIFAITLSYYIILYEEFVFRLALKETFYENANLLLWTYYLLACKQN